MSAPTVTMLAPSSFGGSVNGTPSGTVYVPNADNQVTALYQDILTLQSLGFIVLGPTILAGRIGALLNANFNVTTDQQINLTVPSNALYRVSKITVTNASTSLTTAAGGVYTAASKGTGQGILIANSQVYTALTAAGKGLDLTLALDLRLTAGTQLYLSLTTGQGAAATADVYVFGDILDQ